MAKSITAPEQVRKIEGYELVSSEVLDEIKSVGLVYKHVKSGARVVVVSNDDENKVFSIGFRTPPTDSTGVAHIIEHSVLCGSKKYPPKDPFIELAKGSLNTFLNAITYPDKTIYPIASCNDKDYQNLMNVYLDAVFYPNIYKNEKIFKQEGWHYELDSEDGEVIYNGVVYNEMKGAFSSPKQVVFRTVQNSLFPNTSYSTESGGDPECIPDLTYEDFLAFHGKFYHPANSYIYLYGDMDIEEKLDFIANEYLNDFDRIEVDSEIKYQEPFKEMREMIKYYPIPEEEDTKDKAFLAYNMSIGTSLDKELCFAFEVLDYVLLGTSGAPVKQAILDAGLAKDVFGGYDSDLYQPFFSIIGKDANYEDKDKYIKVVREALEKVVKEGVDKKALKAAINRYEFKHREADFDGFPKGLIYGLDMFDSWLYDDNQPFMRMSLNETYAFLKEKIDTNYYEELIQKYMLDNTYASFVGVLPKAGLGKELEEKTAEKLAKYKETLSEDEIKQLIEDTKALKKFQEEPSTEEELKTIPMLTIGDIKKEAYHINNQIRKVDDVTVVYHDVFTNGIVYFDFLFDLDKVPKTLSPYIGLYAIALGYFNTENYSYSQLDNEINMVTGGMEFRPMNYSIEYEDKSRGSKTFMKVSVRTLCENMDKTLELIKEILFKTNYGDSKRLKEVLQETSSRTNMKITASGHIAAAKRALSYISQCGMFNELTGGIGYYEFLKDIEDNFEEKSTIVSEVFNRLTEMIFAKENLMINFTSDENEYKEAEGKLKDFVDSIPEKAIVNNEVFNGFDIMAETDFATTGRFKLSNKNEGYKTAGKIQYVARAGNFVKKGLEFKGTLNILKVILNYDYLWTNVRVKGGAYGASCSFLRDGAAFFTSYRDPKLKETIDVYEKVVEYIENFDADEREMTKYIIGTISSLDTPLSPYAQGQRDFSAYFTGLTQEEIQKERDEILSAKPEDIRKLADIAKATIEDNNLCVIGNEGLIEKNASLFKEIKNLE